MNNPPPIPPYQNPTPNLVKSLITAIGSILKDPATVLAMGLVLCMVGLAWVLPWANTPTVPRLDAIGQTLATQVLPVSIYDELGHTIDAVDFADLTEVKATAPWEFLGRFNSCLTVKVIGVLNLHLNTDYLYLGRSDTNITNNPIYRFQEPGGNVFETALTYGVLESKHLTDQICGFELPMVWMPKLVIAHPAK